MEGVIGREGAIIFQNHQYQIFHFKPQSAPKALVAELRTGAKRFYRHFSDSGQNGAPPSVTSGGQGMEYA